MSSRVFHVQKNKLGNYFGKKIKVLKLCGISLTGNESIAYKMYSFLALSTSIYTYPFLGAYELTKIDSNEITDTIIIQAAATVAMVKATVMLTYRHQFRKVLTKLEEEPFAPNPERGGDVEEKLVRTCLKITTIQSLLQWSFCYLTVFALFLSQIVTRVRSNDYHDWTFTSGRITVLNVTYSPNYEISVLYQNYCVLFVGGVFTTAELLLASVLVHIGCQFKMLQNCFRQLVEASYKCMMKDTKRNDGTVVLNGSTLLDDVSVLSWTYLKKSLAKAVRYHLAILDLVDEVEQIFSLLLLSTVLATLCELCFIIYSSSVFENNSISLVKYAGEFCNICFQVLIISYWSEQVVQESQKVGQAVYESNFVGTDLRFQKSLVLVIRRSQKPSKLTAGKFTVMSLATFTWILKTSYSSFTVLRTAANNN